jgi:putative intracellular protease/amidase
MNNHVLVYLHEGYADWEIGFILPELVKAGYGVTSVSTDGLVVKSMGGLSVQPDQRLSSVGIIESFKLVILPGGDSWNDPKNHQEILALLPEWHRKGLLIAGICGAVIGLARTGLLDTVKHTSNYLPLTQQLAPNYTGSTLHSDRLAESDQGLITASGVGAMEFSYEILKALQVYDEAHAAEWLNFYKHAIPPQWMIKMMQK